MFYPHRPQGEEFSDLEIISERRVSSQGPISSDSEPCDVGVRDRNLTAKVRSDLQDVCGFTAALKNRQEETSLVPEVTEDLRLPGDHLQATQVAEEGAGPKA